MPPSKPSMRYPPISAIRVDGEWMPKKSLKLSTIPSHKSPSQFIKLSHPSFIPCIIPGINPFAASAIDSHFSTSQSFNSPAFSLMVSQFAMSKVPMAIIAAIAIVRGPPRILTTLPITPITPCIAPINPVIADDIANAAKKPPIAVVAI